MRDRHVLLIEDNENNRYLVTFLLEKHGYTIESAHDGLEGVRMAQLETPALILLDLQLPGMDGYSTARALREVASLRDVPIIAVTSYAMGGDREKALAAGCVGYIEKPIDTETFVAQVTRFLDAQPCVVETAAASQASAILAVPSAATNILVVDDSATNRDLLRLMLQAGGYAVRLAGSAEEARAALVESIPDLIVSDVQMPGENGLAFLRGLKRDSRFSRIPFVFVSASVWGHRDRETAFELGADRFLLRPIEPPVLLAEIGACLERT